MCWLAQGALAWALTPPERDIIIAALRGGDEIGEAPSSALTDEELWRALQVHAVTELGQRIRPSAIDPTWATDPPRRDVPHEMDEARAQGRIAAWISALPVQAPPYRALLLARARYQAILQHGGWPPIAQGPALRVGDTGPGVAAIRVRLASEGYLAESDPNAPFDRRLAMAVSEFQRRHDLVADGVPGEATRRALNVPVDARLSQIEANLERWRWVRDLPAERLEVDIAAAEATLYRDGVARLSMRVIVGDPKHQTPLFASRISSVVFNPPWNVPASIAEKELLPKEVAHPGYLAANGFSRIDGSLRQAPGPKNALGQLKFDFPSPFGVYLHDTPARGLFAAPVRDLSHGCVRLEKPRDLAEALLSRQGWTGALLGAAIDTGETKAIRLAGPTFLVTVYRTVAADPDGMATFHRDPYGWDAKLTKALSAQVALSMALGRPETECGAPKPPQPPL